jgi:hypothetical protein
LTRSTTSRLRDQDRRRDDQMREQRYARQRKPCEHVELAKDCDALLHATPRASRLARGPSVTVREALDGLTRPATTATTAAHVSTQHRPERFAA